jgi:hypothetical protein
MLDAAADGDEGRAALAAWAQAWSAALTDPEIAALEEVVTRHVAAYREKLADNDMADELRGLAAARLFVVGWEGIATPARRGLDGLDEASLAAIPRSHLRAIGETVMAAGRVPEGAEKN